MTVYIISPIDGFQILSKKFDQIGRLVLNVHLIIRTQEGSWLHNLSAPWQLPVDVEEDCSVVMLKLMHAQAPIQPRFEIV